LDSKKKEKQVDKSQNIHPVSCLKRGKKRGHKPWGEKEGSEERFRFSEGLNFSLWILIADVCLALRPTAQY